MLYADTTNILQTMLPKEEKMVHSFSTAFPYHMVAKPFPSSMIPIICFLKTLPTHLALSTGVAETWRTSELQNTFHHLLSLTNMVTPY
jgi:hypothetical protein